MSSEPTQPTPSWLERYGPPLLVLVALIVLGVWMLTHPLTPEQEAARAVKAAQEAESQRAFFISVISVWTHWWVRLPVYLILTFNQAGGPSQTQYSCERLHQHNGHVEADGLSCPIFLFGAIGFGVMEASSINPASWQYLVLMAMLTFGPAFFASAAISCNGQHIYRSTSPGDHGW